MKSLNLKDDSGQTMILTLVCMTVLLGFVGLATDIGLMFRAKRNLQISADAAAIAAVSEMNYGDTNAAGQVAVAQNGPGSGASITVTINQGPSSGAYAGNPNYVEAIVTQTQPTFFAHVFNVLSMDVSARAVATLGPGGCIYSLTPGGTGITFNGMTVNLPTCAIVGDSGMAASSGVVTAAQIGSVGAYTNGGATVNATTLIPGIAAVSDPLAYLTPPAFTPASCVVDPGVTVATTLTPGCYNGLSIGSTTGSVVTLNPGMYIVNGALTITGNPIITGAGVTFYFPNATASLSDGGTETWNLTAPVSPAPYSGVLFYQDPSDTTGLTFNSSANSLLEGIVYAPTANVTVNADATTTLYESFDVGSLTLAGTGTLQNYSAINNTSVLTAAQLVE